MEQCHRRRAILVSPDVRRNQRYVIVSGDTMFARALRDNANMLPGVVIEPT